jgi:mRNA interferase MazF
LEPNIKTDNLQEKYTIYGKTGSHLGKNIPSQRPKRKKSQSEIPGLASSKPFPTRFSISHESLSGWIVVDQIRTIDKRRILRIEGSLSLSEIKTMKSIIRQTFVD